MIDIRADTTELAHRKSRFRGSPAGRRGDQSHPRLLTCYSINIFVPSFCLDGAPARSTVGEPQYVDAFMIRSTPHLNYESRRHWATPRWPTFCVLVLQRCPLELRGKHPPL